MKMIPLRVLPDPPQAEISTMSLIREVIRNPQDKSRGADLDEIRRGIRVLDALEQAHTPVLELEDADYQHLRTKTLAFQWGLIDRRILVIVDDILEATPTLELNGVNGS
jgi:hypothetical protein